jgi:hypothetical protein
MNVSMITIVSMARFVYRASVHLSRLPLMLRKGEGEGKASPMTALSTLV